MLKRETIDRDQDHIFLSGWEAETEGILTQDFVRSPSSGHWSPGGYHFIFMK